MRVCVRRLATHSSADNLRMGGEQCVLRPAMHRDTITCLTAVRPGMIVTGGKDKVCAHERVCS